MKKSVFSIIFSTILLFFGVGLVTQAQGKDAEKMEESWQDESIYYLMIDRFNNGDTSNDIDVDMKDPLAYHGGDFEGVTLQLDYIKDMGFTTIALSPLFDNEGKGYHGYWINDFNKIDEHFGTIADFKKLVKEAHKRKLKVIVELPLNSVGPNHPWLNDGAKQDWFNLNEENNQEKAWVNGLPDLNQENPEVQDYLINAAKSWVKETGIDGYKLDRVQNIPVSFWSQFSKELKSDNPELFLLGDADGNDNQEKYSDTGIDGFFDYSANQVLRTGFAKPDQTLDALFTILEKNKEQFNSPNLMGTFMDNQRMGRFTHEAVVNNLHPGSRWKLALTYLYTAPGIPVVYYGSEIALEGGEEDDNRQQMDFRTDKDLVDYMTKLGELRNQLSSLTKGTLEELYSKDGMIVYKREFEGEMTVIAINNTSKSQNVVIPAEKIAKGKQLQGLLMDDSTKEENGEYKLILDRDEAEIYLLTQKSGLNIPLIIAVGSVYVLFTAFIVILLKRRKRKKNE